MHFYFLVIFFFFFFFFLPLWYIYTWLLEPDQISHTQSMVAKRGLTNRENVHTPVWRSCLKHSTAEFQSIQRCRINKLMFLSSEDIPTCRATDGTTYKHAESWKPADCTTCVCVEGTIICGDTLCPTPACDNPVSVEGECCPQCPGMATDY